MNVRIADRIKAAVATVSTLILLYVAYVSRDHITLIGHWLRIENYQAQTLFVLVDLPALVGKAMQLKYFSASTRKFGRKLTYFSGSLSLACNVVAGYLTGGIGAAGYGVFIVMMFVIMETAVMKIKPAAAVTKAKNAASGKTSAPRPTPRQLAARKAAATRARKAAAPVSPGMAPLATVDSVDRVAEALAS